MPCAHFCEKARVMLSNLHHATDGSASTPKKEEVQKDTPIVSPVKLQSS